MSQTLAASIVGCIGATLSLIASSTIVYMIRRNRNGLKSSYSRIIFGLSIGDILQSWGILCGPFAAPRDTPDSPMALGTTQSCDFFGFIILVGGLLTVFYLIFLIYFFWRRVNHKISPRNFANGEEKYLHILIWLLALAFPSIVASLKDFNSAKFGTVCIIISYPYGCGRGEEYDENYLECTRGQTAPDMAKVYGIILGISLLCLFAMLTAITCHVYSIERTFSNNNNALQANRRRRLRNVHENANPNISENLQEEGFNNDIANERENVNDNQSLDESHHSQNPQIDPGFHEEGRNQEGHEIVDNNNESKESLTKRSLHQSFLYIVTYIITFAAPSAFLANPKLLDTQYDLLLWLIALLVPTYGIFLILIYTRPKVKILSEMFPRASWRLCFAVVVTSGGEVPSPDELRPPRNLPQSIGHQENHPEMEETNGQYYEGLRRSMIAASRYEGWRVEVEGDSVSST